jgi:predicted 2-oxoglutarate/Fe(II)-dependent dioxygenase YbiX
MSQEEEEDLIQSFDNLFAEVERPGDFSVGGTLPTDFALPGITIKDSSYKLSFPLNETHAREIIQIASKSPFGRKEKTLFDDKIRNSWQLDPSQFQINHPNWNTMMQQLINEKVKPGLGILNKGITYSLYKLLLYEKGGHFKPHRDTEKEDRMFATLILQLPSTYEGGEIIVSLRENKQKYDFSTNAEYYPYFAAFYADCEHQIEPVTNGYRICLIYNLIYSGHGEVPKVNDQTEFFNQLAELEEQWLEDDDAPSNLIYILEHQYSAAGLRFKNLKGTDAAIAQLMKKAEDDGLFEIHLATYTKTESGSVEGGYYSGYDMSDVDDITHALEDWINSSDDIEESKGLNITDEQIFPHDRYEDLEVADEEVEEDTGNAGATMERWYKTSVLVFWPKARSKDLWFDIGLDYTVRKLSGLIDKGTSIEECQNLASKIIDRWNSNSSYSLMLNILRMIDSVELANRFLITLRKNRIEFHFIRPLRDLVHKYGWDSTKEETTLLLKNYVEEGFWSDIASSLNSLSPVQVGTTLDPVDLELCQILVDAICNRILKGSSSSYYGNELTPESISKILVALYKLNMIDQIRSIIRYILANSTKFNIVSFSAHLVKLLSNSIGGQISALDPTHPFRTLLDTCIQQIEDIVANPLTPPNNWNLHVKLRCSCGYCKGVNNFLNDPKKKQYSISAKQSDRSHVQGNVASVTKNITFETLKMGSPHTLQMTKVWNSYQTDVTNRQKDIQVLKEMHTIRGTVAPNVTATITSASTSRTSEPPRKKQKNVDEVIYID